MYHLPLQLHSAGMSPRVDFALDMRYKTSDVVDL
jgi:hypothetical protein